jgi:hypothetical protein
VRLPHVLEHVRELKTKGVTLLFLRSPDQVIDGVVSIWNGRFVTSAQLYHSDWIGYPALRQLFTLATGDFAYGKPDSTEIEGLEHDLNIELKTLVPLLPGLPENMSELFDQDSLLEKVFSAQLEPARPNEVDLFRLTSPKLPRPARHVWNSFALMFTAKSKGKKSTPRQANWQSGNDQLRSDPRLNLMLKHRKKTDKNLLEMCFGFLSFWTRTEILVFGSALITFIGLLWLCEKIAPYVEHHLKTINAIHTKIKWSRHS